MRGVPGTRPSPTDTAWTHRGGEAAPQGLELARAQIPAQAAARGRGRLHAPAVGGGLRESGVTGRPRRRPLTPARPPGPTSSPQAARRSGKARRRLRTRLHKTPFAAMTPRPRRPL